MNSNMIQRGSEQGPDKGISKLSAEIVIPSYRRLPILQRTIRQLRLLYPDTHVCLGIQDQLKTEELDSKIVQDGKTRVEMITTPGTTTALNHCIRTSQADVVLIMDDDAVSCHGWLESHLAAFTTDPGLAYTSGREVRSSQGRSSFSELVRILAELAAGVFLRRDTILNGRIVGWTTHMGLIFANFDQPGSCRINAPRGCNMAVRRLDFLKLGGFTEEFRGNAWGFEAEFGVRMAHQGRYGRYLGDAIVIHHELASGGSRTAQKDQWFDDFLFNHRLLIRHLGPQAWIGSLPRLLKKRFFS
jgi:GT2 family glycosyltransferase